MNIRAYLTAGLAAVAATGIATTSITADAAATTPARHASRQ